MGYIDKHHKTILEFLRSATVTGVSFLVDFSVLCLFREKIIPTAHYSLYISTAAGFLFGLAVNYLLSISIVFLSAKGTKIGKCAADIIVFFIIGLSGLIISELGMYLGAGVLSIHYTLVKIVMTLFILVWNFIARKLFIFNGKRTAAFAAAPGGSK